MPDTRACSEVVKEIGQLLAAMTNEAPPLAPTDRSLSKLLAAVTELSKVKNVRPVKCPPDYIALWDRVSSLGAGELSARAIRYLSWETEIAILPTFQALALSAENVSTRSLQGLVRSVHRRWESTVNTPAVANLVHAIARYEGRNPLIEMWKQGLQHVLNQNGPKNFAGSMLRNKKTWDQYANEWGVESDTEFGNQVLVECVALSILRAGSDSGASVSAAISLALTCRHWKNSSFKSSVEQVISWCSKSAPHHAEQIKSFILDDFRLLDPRLPGNMPNWAGISEGARDLVIQWLSAEDIQLFFDHVLSQRNDPHGRKPFWLKYKSKVRRSRPLLSSHDEARWLANAATQGKRNFGQMEFYCDTSAFLLDFGNVIVVEFSKVGNAVYIYEQKNIPGLSADFWSNARFSIRDLKDKTCCVGKNSISHIGDWQREVRTLLAQYGIRPGA
jgi:hypothetical protein